MSGVIYVADRKACRTCVYGVSQSETNHMCNYIGRNNHSRTLDKDGKRRLPKGYCDKYEQQEEQ